ncbi:uncharacterized protein ASPGLDRAFT_1166616 [Aspergillus glaucus CBS 516.65]|uniref:Uncharacterized protein n=1 Tax=Aspergillus glaucus CBS 516.65 TaxID=1160497 RepID=A0A1L9VTY8_ASPGL|nr:hypothetical protein ASPGLDRAFT_1166616 [Aspergillus glaucus CBS 516.65]OJJ87369.1 hypothetical protein ASPGLDRAFT_1166616 [Aspergillus glaucus CBS 516.65]
MTARGVGRLTPGYIHIHIFPHFTSSSSSSSFFMWDISASALSLSCAVFVKYHFNRFVNSMVYIYRGHMGFEFNLMVMYVCMYVYFIHASVSHMGRLAAGHCRWLGMATNFYIYTGYRARELLTRFGRLSR